MLDRREALTNISSSLQQTVLALQALTLPEDQDLPVGIVRLLDAIDRVDISAAAADHRLSASSSPHPPPALTAPIVAPSITPGTCIRLRREHVGLTIENVAMMIESFPEVSVERRIEGLTMIEADVEPISPSTAMVLHEVIGLDLRILAYWMAIAKGATPLLVGVLLSTPNPEPSA